MSNPQRKFDGLAARPAAGVKGRHYYGLRCRACNEQIAVLGDTSKGAKPVRIIGTAEIEIVCPFCTGSSVHQIDDLLAFQQL